MKQCLFVVTSCGTTPSGQPTGVWLSGLTHPYFALLRAGFEADVASPSGGPAPIDPFSHPETPASVSRDDIVSQGFLAAPHHVRALRETIRLEDVEPRMYRGVVICGGNGVFHDLINHPELQRIVSEMWETGRVVASISQGLAALLPIDLGQGPLLASHDVTGLSREERLIAEHLLGEQFPFCLEHEAARTRATFRKRNATVPHVVVSEGRLLTAQNHESSWQLGERLVEALAGIAVLEEPEGPPQYEPSTGLLGALNTYFHQDYEELVEHTILALERADTPVIILAGNDLVLRHHGRRETAVVVPPAYHGLKAIGHTLFGVFLSLEVRRPNGLNETERTRIRRQHHIIDTAMQHLHDEPHLPEALLQDQLDLLGTARAVLADAAKERRVDSETLATFAREVGRRMGGNNAAAQHSQLDAIHRQMMTWLGGMTPEARDQLYVVVCGTHQSRYQDISLVYFTKLLGEVVGPGAQGEDRLLYTESSFDEANALDLVARHIIDQDAGQAFFGDRMRMQRDLLSDGVDDYVAHLLTDCPYCQWAT